MLIWSNQSGVSRRVALMNLAAQGTELPEQVYALRRPADFPDLLWATTIDELVEHEQRGRDALGKWHRDSMLSFLARDVEERREQAARACWHDYYEDHNSARRARDEAEIREWEQARRAEILKEGREPRLLLWEGSGGRPAGTMNRRQIELSCAVIGLPREYISDPDRDDDHGLWFDPLSGLAVVAYVHARLPKEGFNRDWMEANAQALLDWELDDSHRHPTYRQDRPFSEEYIRSLRQERDPEAYQWLRLTGRI